MADETQKLVILLEAQNRDVLRKLAQVEKQFKQTATNGEASVNRLNTSMRRTAQEAGNLSSSFSGIGAQFQDIGVSIAGGMSPGLVALQQGTQIAGQLQMAMAGGASATAVLKSAFASLVSPVALVSIAATAIAGIGLQYLFQAWGAESEKAKTSVELLAQSMERLKQIGLEVSEVDLGDFLSFSQVTRRVEVEIQKLQSILSGERKKIIEQFASEGNLISGSTIFDDLRSAADEVFNVLDRSGNRARESLVYGIKAAAEEFDAGRISAEQFEGVVSNAVVKLQELGVSIPPDVLARLYEMTETTVRLQESIDKISMAKAEEEAKAVLRQLEAMERDWRANVLVNFTMTGDVRKISELLDAVGAPKGLVDPAFDREKQTMELEGAYRAATEGRGAPAVDNLSAQYALRDRAADENNKVRRRGGGRASKQVDSVTKVIQSLELERAKIGENTVTQRIMNEQRTGGRDGDGRAEGKDCRTCHGNRTPEAGTRKRKVYHIVT
jgi:hypothetical protein